MVDWRTEELADPKMGIVAVNTFAALVLVAVDDKGRRVPYELDVFVGWKSDEDHAIAACRLLARLLSVKRLKTVHLPTNQGLHDASRADFGIGGLVVGAVVVALGATLGTSTNTATA